MIYCQKCLHVSPDGSMFCDQCGTSLLINPQRTPPQLQAASPPTPAVPAHVPVGYGLDTKKNELASGALNRPRVRLRLSTGHTFQLSGKTEYLIGRRDEKEHIYPDVDLADYNGAAHGVSRRHALIYVEADGVFIEDQQSRNETIRGGFRLLPFQRYQLQDGDELRLGNIVLLVVIS
jgi:hypothetical protein